MNSKLILIGLLLVLFSTQVYADTTPPVTTFTSFQVPNTTDQNITLTCTDDNSVCYKTSYRINSGAWTTHYEYRTFNYSNVVADYNLNETSGTVVGDAKGTYNGTSANAILGQAGVIGTDYNFDGTTTVNLGTNAGLYVSGTKLAVVAWIKTTSSGTAREIFSKRINGIGLYNYDLRMEADGKITFFNDRTAGTRSTTTASSYNDGQWHMLVGDANETGIYIYVDGVQRAFAANTNAFAAKTQDYQAKIGTADSVSNWIGAIDEVTLFNSDINQQVISYMYNSGLGSTYSTTAGLVGDINFSFIYSGTGVHTIDYNSTDNAGNVETTKTSNFTTYGVGKFTFYDDSLNLLNSINYTITPSINGVSSGTTNGNTLDLNLQAITSQDYTFTFTKPNYTTLSFTLPLTQYTNFDYNFVMLDVNKTTNVNFQVFNESGAYAKTKTFYAYDYSLNKYVGIQTTDTLGRLTFNLDQTKSDYNFFSADFNFGTTTWTINKPKDIVTLSDINGTWGYSITGPSYSNASNIAAGIQKLLLQNTVYPYLIKIVDTNKSYASTTFGLKSVTSEKEKTLTPYLYKYADADLKLIKLIDFATNQPHSSSEELTLSLYTDNNGLIPIGIFVNDSTGTYNIYMDENATYELQVLSQSYTLRPTLDIYYLYLTEDIGIIIDNNLIVDVNAPIMDANLPIIFTQLREAVFGCSSTTDNCYPSMIFSLIAVALLLIVLAISGQIGAISQSITIGILLTMFLIIGFIPLWLYGVGVVILIAWGVFGQ